MPTGRSAAAKSHLYIQFGDRLPTGFMANPLVEHLRKGAAGEGIFARLAALAGGGARRAVLTRLKGLSLARLFLGTTLAFACGVGLGVGVATVIAPEAATIGRMILDLPGGGAETPDGQGAAAEPMVAVRLRQEGDHPAAPLAEIAGPPIARFTPAERKPAEPALAQPGPPAAAVPPEEPAPAAETSAVAADAKPEPMPSVEPAAHDERPVPATPPAEGHAAENHVNVPIDNVLLSLNNIPADVIVAPAAPAEATAPAPETPAAEAATAEPARPADGPRYQYEEKRAPVPLSELQVALGPAGLDGLLSRSSPEVKAPDNLSAVQPPPRPAAKNLQLAALPAPRADAWVRNALALPEKRRDAVIALIIDDMGIDQKRSRAMIALPGPLTLSFIPYGYHLRALTGAARAGGHEVMLHMPMEPLDPEADPGPNALKTTLSIEENRQRLLWALSRVDGIVGLNNHMGSKFTAWRDGMEMVMQEAQARGLLFVDSFTNSESVGFTLARADGLPSAARDVFVDHDITRPAIAHSLEDLEKVAHRRGFAVGIAHPHDLTREGLRKWMAEARTRGIDFVPISYIIRLHLKLVGGRG